MTTTNNLTRAILDYINGIGGRAWRNNTGTRAMNYTRKDGSDGRSFLRFGEKGSGDVLALHRGVFYSIEVKTGRDVLSDDQIRWMTEINERGGVAFEARTIDAVIERVPQ